MDAADNIIAFLRRGADETLLFVCNFAPQLHEKLMVGVPFKGKYKEIFNSDAEKFGGSGKVNPRMKSSKAEECDGKENSITIQTRSIMGTEIPHVKYVPDPGQPTYSFSTTRESIDKAREAFRKVKELTIRLSMIENAAYRLASNIKKTQKRANALQNITIPMYENLVYTISNALEEKEREEFTRLKVIKQMKEKKEKK